VGTSKLADHVFCAANGVLGDDKEGHDGLGTLFNELLAMILPASNGALLDWEVSAESDIVAAFAVCISVVPENEEDNNRRRIKMGDALLSVISGIKITISLPQSPDSPQEP
jgi:hypothetical protein